MDAIHIVVMKTASTPNAVPVSYGPYNMAIYAPGTKFNSWTLIREVARRGKARYMLCSCDCGKTEREVDLRALNSGLSSSCGCSIGTRDVQRVSLRRHGQSGDHRYGVWTGIKQRCTNAKHKHYHRYGGRGITMYQPWADSFELFAADVGECPEPGWELDRRDNEQGYQPGNVRWVPHVVNQRNHSDSIYLTCRGVRKHLMDWCDELGLERYNVLGRLSRGWTHEEALLAPLNAKLASIRAGKHDAHLTGPIVPQLRR